MGQLTELLFTRWGTIERMSLLSPETTKLPCFSSQKFLLRRGKLPISSKSFLASSSFQIQSQAKSESHIRLQKHTFILVQIARRCNAVMCSANATKLKNQLVSGLRNKLKIITGCLSHRSTLCGDQANRPLSEIKFRTGRR